MDKATRKRGQQTLNELVRTVDALRALLAKRIEEIDIDEMGKRGTRMAGSMRNELGRRVRPPRRGGLPPAAVAGIAGLVLASIAVAGVGYLLYDRERREEARRRLNGVQSRARERYAELTGARSKAEDELEARVREAVAAGGPTPDGLEVVVEGRTVYLRGLVSDPAIADAAAERAHEVPGVVAVVNLTTGANRSPATPTTNRTSKA